MSGESYNNAYSVLENRRLAMKAKYFAKMEQQDDTRKNIPISVLFVFSIRGGCTSLSVFMGC